MQQLAPKLVSAVQDDLVYVSNQLLSHGVIHDDSLEEFTNLATPKANRASNLIRTVLNRIKLDSCNFEKFVKVLEDKEWYYEAVLKKLRDDLVVTKQPTANQDPSSDFEQSDNESSALLRTPYVRLESEDSSEDERRRILPPSNYVKSCNILCFCLLSPIAFSAGVALRLVFGFQAIAYSVITAALFIIGLIFLMIMISWLRLIFNFRTLSVFITLSIMMLLFVCTLFYALLAHICN